MMEVIQQEIPFEGEERSCVKTFANGLKIGVHQLMPTVLGSWEIFLDKKSKWHRSWVGRMEMRSIVCL